MRKLASPSLRMVVLLILMVSSSRTPAAPTQLAANPDNKDKIIGKWILTESTNKWNGVPPGCTVEYKPDGSFIAVVATGHTPLPGTFKVDGDKLLFIVNWPDGREDKDTFAIITLTDKKLITTYTMPCGTVVTDTYTKQKRFLPQARPHR